MNERWLTPSGKARELAFWDEYRRDAEGHGYTGDLDRPVEPGHATRRPGHGYVDRGVLPLVDALNEIECVCTLQSCEGHWYGESDGRYAAPAQLWLWLAEPIARRFYERVGELEASPLIEQVALLWGRDREKEIIDVQFDGVSRGHIDESADLLTRFFRSLRPRGEA